MSFRNRQKGLSGIGWIMLILMISGTVMVITRLLPHYMDFNSVSSIVESMTHEPGLVNRNTNDLTAMLKKRMKINNIRDWKFDERIKIKRNSEGVLIDVNYEVREPIISNLSFVMVFSTQAKLQD